jgi:long-chain acyl-CoA synthetase
MPRAGRDGDAGFIEPEIGASTDHDRAKDVGKMANGALFASNTSKTSSSFFPERAGSGRSSGTAVLSAPAFINIDLTAVGMERNNIGYYASYQELARHPQVKACSKSRST